MDYLDILNGTGQQTYKGEYYAEVKAPIGIDQAVTSLASLENPVPFFYEPVENSRVYDNQHNLLNRREEEATIKTKSAVMFGKELEGFVKLSDGNFYQIISVSIDRKGISKQAALYVPVPVGADYVVRLTKIDNPFKEYVSEESVTLQEYDYDITVVNNAGLTASPSNPTEISTVFGYDTPLVFTGVSSSYTYTVTATNATVEQSISGTTLTVTLTNITANTTVTLTRA